MIKLFAILVLLHTTYSIAFTTHSLTWQKLALEEKVQRKVSASIGPLLKDNQYMVEVNAEITDPGAPNFGNDNPTGTRVSDLKLEESRGDYIAFSKVGLEVPVVDKFLDEDRTKLMNLYRYNEAFDLFKNLDAIVVTVFLSDKLPADLFEIVKKVVSGSKLSVAGIKPAIKFESIPMEWVDPELAKKAAEAAKPKELADKKEVEPKIWAKDWFEWASRWGNAVGLILAALIIGLMALSLFKQWKNFMENFAAQAKKDNEEENKEDKKNEDMAMSNQPSMIEEEEEEDMATSQGFERFQQCLEQHPDDAVTIIRSWLNESDEQSLLALRAVSQLSSGEELEKLMNGLSEQQRDNWKSLLGTHLEPQELKAANKHIFQEVIKAFLVPSRIKDGELLNLVMELNSKSTSEFISKYPEQTGIILNILSPSIISKILLETDEETAEQWLMEGAEFPVKSMDEKVPALKTALQEYKASYGPSPFAQRIMTMIPSSSPSREKTLYRALSKAGNPGMIMEVAKKNFPSELIMDLPSSLIKEVVQSYPMAKRIELIHSRPIEVQDSLVDILAEKGTPAREMLDMELENIARDPSNSASIKSREEEIWQEFVKATRSTLSKNASYAGFTDQLVKEWGQKLSKPLSSIQGGKAA